MEAIAAALLTATTWFQTTHSRPDVFADMFIAPKLKKRMVAFAQAAERHLIFQGERNLTSMEAEMETIRLPLPSGPSALAPPAPMVQDPPPRGPADRKGKAPICTAPRPKPIKPVVAFQRPPPPINLATHPRKSFAATVRNTKGPVKATAPHHPTLSGSTCHRPITSRDTAKAEICPELYCTRTDTSSGPRLLRQGASPKP